LALHALDEIDRDARHDDSGSVKGSTWTTSPAATSPRASSRTMKQLAATIDERIPEPWEPVVRTSQAPSRYVRLPALHAARAVVGRGARGRGEKVDGTRRRRPASL